MNFGLDVVTLDGRLVRLEPLSLRHIGDLRVAAEEDRSSYAFTAVPRSFEMEGYLASHFDRANNGQMVPFAQTRKHDGFAVGCTTLWNPRFWPDRSDLCAIEIGWTWLAASAQRTGINVEAKLLLFEYAFETMGVVRVDLKTDARNERSRRAIEALGARFEGVLRSWSESHAPLEQGLLRDSAMFSVLASEWPTVKSHLIRRMAGEDRSSASRQMTVWRQDGTN